MGKGYCHRALRAVPTNLVPVLTTVVLIGGVRVGLVRRTRFGATGQEAVANIFTALPESAEQRPFSVDAGIATIGQFRAATGRDALGGACARTSHCVGPLTPSPPGQTMRSEY